MSKLEELIKEFCPNGVEYKKLGELGKFYGGLSGKSKNDFTNGNEKFITYKNVYANPSLNLDVEDRVKINPGERQNTLQYGDIIFTGSSETPDECGFSSVITTKTSEKLYLNSFCFFFRLDNQSILLPDFAKHLFRAESIRYQIGKTASGVTRYNVSKDKMKQVQIPLPALPVQREIVRILDSFTLYSAELTAELTARRKQYEFYRDKLLTFDDLSSKVETFTIEDICKTITDFTAAGSFADIAKNVVYKSTPDFARLVRTMDIKSNFTKGEPVYVDENAFKYLWRVNFDQDCIILPNIGNCGEVYYVGKGTLPYQNNVLGPNAIMLKNISCNVRYLYHLLLLSDFQNDLRRIISPGGQTKFNKTELKKIKIKIPPIEVQERIVKVLDNFDAICSDLGIGLPAEIEKRQKQYEYYREKLLTFDGKYATILTERNGTERNGQG